MKLEYLASGSPDCPLIRLYDFHSSEAAGLLAAIDTLARASAERVEVHRLPFVESMGGCRLVFVRRRHDAGIASGPLANEFECGFTADTWDNVAGLLEPFAEGAVGHQWLADQSEDAALLVTTSPGGEW